MRNSAPSPFDLGTAPAEAAAWDEGLFILREPPLLHALGEDREQPLGVVPPEAGVRDRDAVRERLSRHDVLAAGIEMALDHHAEDPLVARRELAGHVARDVHLALVLL